ncbi:MAG: DUF3576 domain-containing protein [Paracoccaceae bacterium]
MKKLTIFVLLSVLLSFSSCGKKIFGDIIPASDPPVVEKKETLIDFFQNKQDPNTAIGVNRYIWIATLDVLNFLPIEAADPFTGIISFGFGNIPGSKQMYRGTVLINDPALDARSLKISLITKNGIPIDLKTRIAVEDAILNRARQIYQEEAKL